MCGGGWGACGRRREREKGERVIFTSRTQLTGSYLCLRVRVGDLTAAGPGVGAHMLAS